MIKIGILGDIGSGKSHVAKNFGYPVFNADVEVGKLYKKEIKIFNKLKKVLPKFINTFPVNKKKISDAILANKSNLKKIIKIIHIEIKKKLNIFLKKK
jgi:dephospho-CoA kinase